MNRLIYSNWRPPSRRERETFPIEIDEIQRNGETTKRKGERRISIAVTLTKNENSSREKSCLSLSKGNCTTVYQIRRNLIVILEGKEISLARIVCGEPNMVTIIRNGLITSIKYILRLIRQTLDSRARDKLGYQSNG